MHATNNDSSSITIGNCPKITDVVFFILQSPFLKRVEGSKIDEIRFR